MGRGLIVMLYSDENEEDWGRAEKGHCLLSHYKTGWRGRGGLSAIDCTNIEKDGHRRRGDKQTSSYTAFFCFVSHLVSQPN